MAVAYTVTFKTTKADQITSQLQGYKERELDRNPPPGFRSAVIEEHATKGVVHFRTEWADDEALDEVRDGAPWEACMDLCGIYADGEDETRETIA